MTSAKQTAMSLYGFSEWPGTHIRHKAAADCRTYACLLLRDEGYSLNQTAKELGYADHTAVIWAIKRYDGGKLDGHDIKVNKEKNMRDEAVKNTDRELYREPDKTGNGDYYSPSIHVTKEGGIGINVGGYVVVKPLREWHDLATQQVAPSERISMTKELEGAPDTDHIVIVNKMINKDLIRELKHHAQEWSGRIVGDRLTEAAEALATSDARTAELEAAMKTIIEGDYPQTIKTHWRVDKSYNKNDECIHGLPRYNGCENCICEYLQSALKTESTT